MYDLNEQDLADALDQIIDLQHYDVAREMLKWTRETFSKYESYLKKIQEHETLDGLKKALVGNLIR